LTDNDSAFSVSGLSMLLMGKQKGCIEQYMQLGSIGSAENVWSMLTSSCKEEFEEQDASVVFDSWTKEDYLNMLKISQTIKESGLEILVDFFDNSEQYAFGENSTISEFLSGTDSDKVPVATQQKLP